MTAGLEIAECGTCSSWGKDQIDGGDELTGEVAGVASGAEHRSQYKKSRKDGKNRRVCRTLGQREHIVFKRSPYGTPQQHQESHHFEAKGNPTDAAVDRCK